MFKPPKADSIGFQARTLAAIYREKRVNMLAAIDTVRAGLVYGPNTTAAEGAMKILGTLLGLTSTRPNADVHTGPDNLWCGEGEVEAWGFELKSDKKPGTEYAKSEIDQSLDHINWLKREKRGKRTRVSIVGPEQAVSNLANPDPELRHNRPHGLSGTRQGRGRSTSFNRGGRQEQFGGCF